jgi:type I restriction enzyme R subunit
LLEYFRKATAITAAPPDRPTRSIQEVIEAIWDNRDRDYNIRCLVKRLQRIEKEMAGEAREMFAAHGVTDGDMGRYARGLPGQLKTAFVDTMKLLRDVTFQGLLTHHPRKSDPFVVAGGTEDSVESEVLIGQYKPEDYLAAFKRFVEENAEQIDAIGILLDHPKDWSRNALAELRDKLKTTPQRFSEENLQKAHELYYNKALVEVISMVKHAAREQEPLYTAQERVEQAFSRITTGRAFTPEQQQWLERIRAHLITLPN